jgi:isopentenyldiphosphate isomerase
MSQDELFDIFNSAMVNTGTASRREVHAKGLWHQTFHCWVVSRGENGEEYLLLQLRHPDKDTYPDMLDISAAGHLLHGEEVEDGVRELEEELGIKIDYGQLAFAGTVAEECVISETLMDREFCHVHILECSQPLKDYQVQLSEVSGLFPVRTAEFRELVKGSRKHIDSVGIIYEEDGRYRYPVNRSITLQDVTPNTEAYYHILFTKLEELALGRK